MPLMLSHRVHPEYLEAIIEGDRTQGEELLEVLAIWEEIFSLSLQHQLLNILTRNAAQGKFPLNAQINMALGVEEMGCTKSHRIACVAYTDQQVNDQQLIVKYAQAQGYTSQLFDKEGKAVDWLLHATPGKREMQELSTET